MTGSPSDRRAAVVTGSAGGIGSAVCERLLADGFAVVGLDLVASPAGCESIVIDLADTARVKELAAELAVRHPVAALVHVAASQPLGASGEVAERDWIDAFRVNVLAVETLVGAFGEPAASTPGSVVVVTSVHGRATTPGMVAYATTKAALEGWVRAAALDLGPAIRVNALMPGAIDTPKLQEGFARWDTEDAHERRQVLSERTPLRRIGRPDEVAAAVSFLVGEQAGFMTGSTLVLDGGALARLGSE